MNQAEDEARRKIERLVESNENLKSEVKSAWELVNQALMQGITIKDKENISNILNKIGINNEDYWKSEKVDNIDVVSKNVIQWREFLIVPSKIVACLISNVKSLIKTEQLHKNSLIKQNNLLFELKEKNEEINNLKLKTKQINFNHDSINHSNYNENTIDDEIREKLYQLENDNFDLQTQLNNKVIASESFLNDTIYENNCQFKQDIDNQKFIDPMIDSILYLVNKLCIQNWTLSGNFLIERIKLFKITLSNTLNILNILDDSKLVQTIENESDSTKIEIAQRIVIKALTDTLSKVISDNENSQINIQGFVPSRDDDRTAWYLDLLETQLSLTKDLISDLQDYYSSLKEDSKSSNSKQLKATYYELASNTQNVSSQVENISKIYFLIKQDLEWKLNHSRISWQYENDPSLFGNEKSKNNSQTHTYQFSNNLARGIEGPEFGKYIVPSEKHISSTVGGLQSTVEHMKNELKLSNKIKETLEKQLHDIKKQNVSNFHKFL